MFDEEHFSYRRPVAFTATWSTYLAELFQFSSGLENQLTDVFEYQLDLSEILSYKVELPSKLLEFYISIDTIPNYSL